ncbi:unnamed protein product [Tilletia caries]|nr:hypothetical protein CF328_g5987 [Tilletia controversa]CAD6887904.1 unnamed protein product [Tilletia caries]
MARSNDASPGHDLVAVIGCTGTGKSKLAVELAQHVQRLSSSSSSSSSFGNTYANAQIISADSMQVYRGLDVITNKATVGEMGGVQHHLMSFLDAGREYTIKDFTSQAGVLISSMHDEPGRPTLPIVAGGTSYYVQHLLFPGRLVSAGTSDDIPDEDTKKEISPKAREAVQEELSDELKVLWAGFLAGGWHTVVSSEHEQEGSKELTSQELWTLLNALDPPIAARWHPNDHRKILRSLTVFATTGRRHSDWLRTQQEEEAARQRSQEGGSVDEDGSSRFFKMRRLFFWVWCEPEVLKARLDARIHKMIESGLLDEIRELRTLAKDLCDQGSPDYTRGIFQAIGFKEFDTFLNYMDSQPSSSCSTAPARELDDEAQRLFDSAVESMQRGTRQYAKRQASWIRNQLLPEVRKAREQMSSEDDVEVYLLDATDLEKWGEKVSSVAQDILERFLHRQPLPNPAELNSAAAEHLQRPTSSLGPTPTSVTNAAASSLSEKAFVPCQLCSPSDPTAPPFLVRVAEMEAHQSSRRHRMAMKRSTKVKYDAARKAEAEERRRVAAAEAVMRGEQADAGAGEAGDEAPNSVPAGPTGHAERSPPLSE